MSVVDLCRGPLQGLLDGGAEFRRLHPRGAELGAAVLQDRPAEVQRRPVRPVLRQGDKRPPRTAQSRLHHHPEERHRERLVSLQSHEIRQRPEEPQGRPLAMWKNHA